MLESICRYLLVAKLLLIAPLCSLSGAEDPVRVSVGLREAAPFTMQAESGAWSGVAVELWEAIAEKNNFSFEYTTYPLAVLRIEREPAARGLRLRSAVGLTPA